MALVRDRIKRGWPAVATLLVVVAAVVVTRV